MRFIVRHQTLYRYDVPVTLAPHVVRLTPRDDQGTLITHELDVQPRPIRRQHEVDEHGNRFQRLEFADACQQLEVTSSFELETTSPPEIALSLPELPWVSVDSTQSAYLGQGAVDSSVLHFAQELAADAGHSTLAFLDQLTHTLYTSFERQLRHSGDANAPAETLSSRRGACRDLAVLFMEAARSLGIPSRFVSGYQAQAETVDGRRHLHAWPEVFLPGVGFRAWDPTHGVRVGAGHVALFAAPTQAQTMPIEGAYFFSGESLRSTLDFSLHITTGRAAS